MAKMKKTSHMKCWWSRGTRASGIAAWHKDFGKQWDSLSRFTEGCQHEDLCRTSPREKAKLARLVKQWQ
jgi:hypothetical protein